MNNVNNVNKQIVAVALVFPFFFVASAQAWTCDELQFELAKAKKDVAHYCVDAKEEREENCLNARGWESFYSRLLEQNRCLIGSS